GFPVLNVFKKPKDEDQKSHFFVVVQQQGIRRNDGDAPLRQKICKEHSFFVVPHQHTDVRKRIVFQSDLVYGVQYLFAVSFILVLQILLQKGKLHISARPFVCFLVRIPQKEISVRFVAKNRGNGGEEGVIELH